MNFRIGSIPVRINGRFFLIIAILGQGYRTLDRVAIWVAVVLVSVLIHELGHALVGRAFGLAPKIELHGMGGTTSWQAGREVGNARSIAISLAGPFAGFLVAGLLALALRNHEPIANPLVDFAIAQAFAVNIGWGIMNLVPMLPLDGGNVMRAVFKSISKGRGETAARILSIGVAGLGLVYAANTRSMWLGFLSALFIYTNVKAYREIDQRAVDGPLAQALQKASVALEAQDGKTATELLRPVLAANASPELHRLALRLYSYGLLLEGRWGELMPLLSKERATLGADELTRYAQTARETGRGAEATEIDAIRQSLATA